MHTYLRCGFYFADKHGTKCTYENLNVCVYFCIMVETVLTEIFEKDMKLLNKGVLLMTTFSSDLKRFLLTIDSILSTIRKCQDVNKFIIFIYFYICITAIFQIQKFFWGLISLKFGDYT